MTDSKSQQAKRMTLKLFKKWMWQEQMYSTLKVKKNVKFYDNFAKCWENTTNLLLRVFLDTAELTSN